SLGTIAESLDPWPLGQHRPPQTCSSENEDSSGRPTCPSGRRCGSRSCEFTPAHRETSSRRHFQMRMILVLLLALAWNADGQLPKETRSDAGIDVHLSVRPFGASKAALREGVEAELTVRLTDSASTPITG